jgi:hypothetical protein
MSCGTKFTSQRSSAADSHVLPGLLLALALLRPQAQ